MSNFYVTTPIYYVTQPPHIGTSYTTIACDILARYHKLKGNDVYFTSGTDCHGSKILNAANEAGEKPKVFTDRMSKTFKDLISFLNCEINDFIKTTEDRHKKSVHSFWKKLEDNNNIYLDFYEGWYSVSDETFYQEDELIKKDDNKLYAPSGSKVEWLKEESYFFKLSKWQDKLLDYYTLEPERIGPKHIYNEIVSFIKSGLKDLSISRSTVKWGIPVPGNNSHTCYVWFEALINYCSLLGYPDEKNYLFEKFWSNSFHIIGKDISRHHMIIWPAMLMAANLPTPKRVYSHGWWTVEKNKMSKSLKNVVDPYVIINKFGLDQVRYFMFTQMPFGNDGDFSTDSLIAKVNSDLSNNFGNLIQRVCSFINKNCDSIIENKIYLNLKEDKDLIDFSLSKFEKYNLYLDNQEIDKAIKEAIELSSKANVYCDKLAPWNLKKTDTKRMNEVLSLLVDIIRRSSLMLFPVIPDSIKKIYSILNISEDQINFDYFDQLPQSNYKINTTVPIFPRIETTDQG